MARLQAQRLEIALMVKGTLEEVRKQHVALAKREHAAIFHTEPRPSSFIRYVDGRAGVPEEAVKPAGLIVYTYARLDEVAMFALEVLRALSPVASGEYRTAHQLFVNTMPAADVRAWEPGQEVAITNLMPYSRVIEIGKMKMRVPGTSRVYAQAAKIVEKRYGNIAEVRFTYRGVVDFRSVDNLDVATRVRTRDRRGRFTDMGGPLAHNKPDARFPTLLISELGTFGRKSARRPSGGR